MRPLTRWGRRRRAERLLRGWSQATVGPEHLLIIWPAGQDGVRRISLRRGWTSLLWTAAADVLWLRDALLIGFLDPELKSTTLLLGSRPVEQASLPNARLDPYPQLSGGV